VTVYPVGEHGAGSVLGYRRINYGNGIENSNSTNFVLGARACFEDLHQALLGLRFASNRFRTMAWELVGLRLPSSVTADTSTL